MPPSPPSPVKSRFTRAVEALCLTREEIARALKVTPALLDAYTEDREPIPPMVKLELVDLLKSHEAMLGSSAGSLYDEAMYRLESDGLARPVARRDTPPLAGGPGA